MKNQSQRYIFYCELCQKRFNNVTSFNTHRTYYCTTEPRNTENKLIKQYINRTKHPRKQLLEVRKVTITNVKDVIKRTNFPRESEKAKKIHRCEFCGKIYATLRTRLRHEAGYCKKKNTTINSYPCERCNKQFATAVGRSFHMKMHCYDKNHEMKYACAKCDRKFPFKHTLQRHLSRRHDHAFFCDYCERSFYDKHHLNRHIMGHMGIKPFKCNICSQKFSRKYNLHVHIQRHSNKKDYGCKICNKKFKFNNHLEKHIKLDCSVENIKKYPFLCDICKKRFKDKQHIQRHMINIHVKKFPCDICGKVFGQKLKLNQHLHRVTHEKRYSCNLCPKKFVTRDRFLHHKAIHFDYPCQCGEKFNLRYEYYKHRTYWCAKTAGMPIDEIVKNDPLLSKSNKKSEQTKSVKAKKQYDPIKKISITKGDNVNDDKNNKIDNGRKSACGDETNITGPVSNDSEDNCSLHKLATVNLENKSSDTDINQNREVFLKETKE